MKKANKWLALLLAIIMIASIGLAGCGKDDVTDTATDTPATTTETPSTEEPKPEGPELDAEQVLNYNLGGEPTALDSTIATYSHDFEVLNNIQEGLTRVGLDGMTVEGGIAESWDVNEDNTKYTFHLRDAKWSNGEPVTAKDFEFGWKLALNPITASQYGFIFASTNVAGANEYNTMAADADVAELQAAADAVGVKAIDEKTLEVTLHTPSAFFSDLIAFCTFFPVNQKFYESLTPGDYGTDPDKLLFNGPFKMTEWIHDQSIKLEKNENYWDAETVKIETINYAMVTDSNTSFNLYLSGDLDSVGIPAQFLDQYREDLNAHFVTEPTTWWLYTNLLQTGDKGAYLTNQNFRQALSSAFNRKQLIDVVWSGTREPAYGLIPPRIKGSGEKPYREQFPDVKIVEDAAKAKEMLAKAQEEVGKPLPTFDLLAGEGDVVLKIAQVLQEQWKQLGVETTINQQPSKVQKELRRANQYDLSLNGWGADYNDPSSFMDLYTSDNPFNEIGFKDARYDELVKGSATETDNAKRMANFAEAEKIMLDSGAIIPIWHNAGYVLRQPYVHDIARYVTGAGISFKWAYVSGK